MKTPSILLVVEGGPPRQGSLGRAMQLARAMNARLDILLWRGWSSAAAAEQRYRVGELQRAQLPSMSPGTVDAGLEVTTHVSFGGKLLPIVAEKVEQFQVQLVIKQQQSVGPEESACRELIQSCPAPLLLTDGRPWSPRPRFAVAVNLEQNLAISRQIIRFTSALQRACSADLDLICGERADGRCSLPRLVHARPYDLLAIGRPDRHQHGCWDFSAANLTDALVRAPRDLLVVQEYDEAAVKEPKGAEALAARA